MLNGSKTVLPPRFFLDFDGTIAGIDVVDRILECHATPEWREVENEWTLGKIGSRECLSRQLALVNLSKEELSDLIASVPVDEGFASFIRLANQASVPVAIVSDGFDLVIEGILRRVLSERTELANSIPVYCNKLLWKGNGVEAVFATDGGCAHGCANCKPAVIRRLRRAGETVVFVGDGLSDRFAAAEADLTFAKSKLLDFCRKNNLNHAEYHSFRDIEAWLSSRLAAGAAKTTV